MLSTSREDFMPGILYFDWAGGMTCRARGEPGVVNNIKLLALCSEKWTLELRTVLFLQRQKKGMAACSEPWHNSRILIVLITQLLLNASILMKFLPGNWQLFQDANGWNFLKRDGLCCLLESDERTESFQNF